MARIFARMGAALAALALFTQPAAALVTAPTYLTPSGQVAATIGIVCINPDLSSCTFGGGGGASYTAAASPFAVAPGVNKPAWIDSANSAQGVELLVPGSTAAVDLSAAASGIVADGAAPVPTDIQIATRHSGVMTAVTSCDLHAFYDASDNGKKTIIAGQANKKIYICGYKQMTGGTATNLELGSGTGTDCVTTYTKIIATAQLVANDRDGANAPFWNGLSTLANADNLCGNASAGNAHQWDIWYTVQ